MSISNVLSKIEDVLAVLVLGAMVLLAAGNAIARIVSGLEVPGGGVYIQHLNLLVGFFGAIVATRVGRHLTLSTGNTLAAGRLGWLTSRVGGTMGGAVSLVLAWASWEFAVSNIGSPTILPGGISVWVFQMIMPLGFVVMGIRFFWRNTTFLKGLPFVIVAMGLAAALVFLPEEGRQWLLWPAVLVLLASGLLGTPIFVVMAATSMLLFFAEDVTISAVPAEMYTIATSPNLHVIPLFAFAGYLLARGGASRRLIRLFNSWFGWMPGGVAVVTALVCAFFTTFTGASGVTILGLGGVLLPLLVNAGYSLPFSLGLLTTAGSLGMLFPPSLPVILYGVRAGTSVLDMFLGGVVPGLLLLGTVIIYGVFQGLKLSVPRPRFSFQEAFRAMWEARYEILLPIILFSGLFGGLLNLGEAASLTTLYIVFVECVLTREMKLTRDVPAAALECAIVIGALLIIFGAALGMTSYMVDAEIPNRLTAWVQENIHQKWLFILVLNCVLLVVGSLMEGFSAIVILVPLVTPIGAAFGFHPVHLGILFLANLEVGFLLPPVGLNLFLSSIRFEQPLASLYRPILPFLLLMFGAVLVISYVPWLSLALLSFVGSGGP